MGFTLIPSSLTHLVSEFRKHHPNFANIIVRSRLCVETAPTY